MMNITYEIIQLAGQELQKAAKYQGIEEVESLKFSDNWIRIIGCEIVEKPKEKRQIQQTMTKFLTANINK